MKDFCSPVSRGMCCSVLFLAAILSTAFAPHATAQTYDRSGPWWKIVPRPMLSMAYTPEPADYDVKFTCPFPDGCKYFDSDFYNSDFKHRRSVRALKPGTVKEPAFAAIVDSWTTTQRYTHRESRHL